MIFFYCCNLDKKLFNSSEKKKTKHFLKVVKNIVSRVFLKRYFEKFANT